MVLNENNPYELGEEEKEEAVEEKKEESGGMGGPATPK